MLCDSLGDFHELKNKTSFAVVWDGYSRFLEAVSRSAPGEMTLRDKDRWLWGKSFYEDLERLVYESSPMTHNRQA